MSEHTTTDPLNQNTLLTVISALVADELKALRHTDDQTLDSEHWSADTLLRGQPKVPGSTEPDLAVVSLHADSLEIMALATRVNTFFQVHHSGIEDYLLRYTTLGEWAALVSEARQRGSRDISFSTSGSTGEPKRCDHQWARLVEEVRTLHPHFANALGQPVQRVVALCPPHHIYGFLFSVILPAQEELPVVRGQAAQSLAWRGGFEPGDLILGYPYLWQQLSRLGLQFPVDTLGVSSTGPCDPIIVDTLKQQGLSGMMEIYGASETGGIGWRTDHAQPFTLLPRWQRSSQANDEFIEADSDRAVPLSDRVRWVTERSLLPTGRKDDAVQVGGVNVFPQRIAEQLASLPGVSAARVRLMRPGEGDRLKAYIVPAKGQSASELRQQLLQWSEHHLNAPERPRAFNFGPALPVNTLHKAADWDIQPAPAGLL